ncbi:uncharacterized protein LOC134701996 [Mytilus trossulus]|uniref:uncharacterized protein LOC134701996 n=1 Tax=Mytilus trossulus TaxID=6551 RepID=UPI0030045531
MDLMFLLILAAVITGTDVCNIQICLTWTVQNNYLDIRCRVNNLRFGVVVVNNRQQEQGFCIHPRPTPKCVASNNNTEIMQNSLTNITYLRIQGEMDRHFNGRWECKHGTNRDSATINVTILNSYSKNIQDPRCWQSYFAYTMIGFSCPVYFWLCIFVTCRGKRVESTCKTLWKNTRLKLQKYKTDEESYIIVGVAIALLFPIPIKFVVRTEKDVNGKISIQDSPKTKRSSDTGFDPLDPLVIIFPENDQEITEFDV